MKDFVLFLKPLVLIFAIIVLVATVGAVIDITSPHSEEDFVAAALLSEGEYKNYFTRLAREKGALYAFSVLGSVSPASGIDTHDIGHQIGYILHEEKGVGGLSVCTKDFKYACMHAVITQEFVVNGTSALSRLVNVCSQKTPNSGQWWSCFHGIGHGVLAWTKYDYQAAVSMCADVHEAMGTSDASAEAWQECIRGATMELMQGNHDRVAWERAQKDFMPESDVLMPCNAPFMQRDIRPACYKYLHTRFFWEVGSEGGEAYPPSDEKDSKVFAFCARIPENEAESQQACYEGIGAVFSYFANGSDSRSFRGISDDALSQVHTRCARAGEGHMSCMLSASRIVFNTGEDGGDAAMRFCTLAPDDNIKKRCHESIAESAGRHMRGASRIALCVRLPEEIRHGCIYSSSAYTEIQ